VTPDPRIRALIVDDEPLAIDGLRAALEREPDIRVIGSRDTGRAAVTAIRDLAPDLVFLDVQMPGVDGFGVIEEIGADAMPEVVFVTAYDEHALRAFEVHAVDYLLKPFDNERLAACVRHAVNQVRTRRQAGERERELSAVLSARAQTAGPADAQVMPIRRLLVRQRDRLLFIDAERVDWCEAAGNYVRLYVGDETHLIRMSLSELATRLDARDFVRIHRSAIVNVHRIRELQPWAGGDYLATLTNGRKLKVSRTYRDDLLQPLA
jgi:two-component system LytT family response regulator